jgi:glycosyltransferase involved in cell wall biosynthesis
MHSKLGYYEKNTRNLKFYINLIGKVKNIRQVKKFDQLVVLTQGDATAWSRYKRPIIIPNFINHTEYTRPKDKQCYHRIICAGRLDYEKGYDLLIRAYSLIYKNHKDWIIDIFGNGTEKDKLMNLINEIGLNEYIHINVPSSKIYDEYQKSDFLVFCSRFEGFGLVLAEAMSCSIPCVSFNCDYGPKEIIENQKDGLLVRNGDIKDLANKIEWMMTHNKEREVMGINAYHKSKKYSIEPIMEKWTKLYDEIYKSL